MAKDFSADTVLQFHNHPNAILYASQQDLESAQYLGKTFNNNGINYFTFVCGAVMTFEMLLIDWNKESR